MLTAEDLKAKESPANNNSSNAFIGWISLGLAVGLALGQQRRTIYNTVVLPPPGGTP